MSKRSPILGYNHNIRHRGVVFHVQTEDSGVSNPHIFTHLFHGGVILSTRKLDYDAEAAEEVVKSLMQAQHKAVLRELKKGRFDEKIDSYLGGLPELLPRGAGTGDTEPEVADGPLVGGDFEDAPESAAEVSAVFKAIQQPPGPAGTGQYAQHRRRSSPTSKPPPGPARPAAPPQPRRPAASGGVVVSRPAVIIGAPPTVVGGAPPSTRAAATAPARPRPRKAREDASPPGDGIFGQDLISEKSLDEVILAYLSEDAPEE